MLSVGAVVLIGSVILLIYYRFSLKNSLNLAMEAQLETFAAPGSTGAGTASAPNTGTANAQNTGTANAQNTGAANAAADTTPGSSANGTTSGAPDIPPDAPGNAAPPEASGSTAAGSSARELHFAATAIDVVSQASDTGKITTLTTDTSLLADVDLSALVSAAVSASEPSGTLPAYRLTYMKVIGDNTTLVAFAGSDYVSSSILSMAGVVVICDAVFLILLFFISLFLSKAAIRPIEAAWEKQRQFTADASHELKTPLTVILANNKILRAHPQATIQSQEEWLVSTEEEANHMRLLIDDMLSLARNEQAGAAIRFAPVDFSRVVDRTMLQFEAVAFDRQVTLTGEIAPAISISGDETRLRQLAMILIDNGIKYEPAGGTVTVRLAVTGHTAVFTVKNARSEIAPEILPHVFDRFYRADASRSSEGYGLGLSIAESIAALHHGRIRADSGKGEGTIFEVTLPVKS